ncbi:MAG: hypothetical protein HFI33_06000 [Lachnospiraceae bacterium]|nr:hypothetical protein [Lachnospiraceae bacterium]
MKPILFCKCKMCGSTFLDEYPKDRTKEDVENIGKFSGCITVTHDCSKAEILFQICMGWEKFLEWYSAKLKNKIGVYHEKKILFL